MAYPPKTGREAHVEPVEHFLLFAIPRRLRGKLSDLAVVGRLDVMEPAQLIAAAPRQPRVARHRDAVRIEVGRRRGLIDQGQEVAVPRTKIANVEPEPRAQLLLERSRSLPVELSLPPS